MAPVPDLYPIVIPLIEVKTGNKTFTCAGDGLLKDGHGYESNLKQFLPLTEPKKTKAGNIASKQPAPQSKPLAFWKAQCAFRNFVQNGSIETLQSRLRGTDPKMDKDLAKEQTRVNKEFRILNDDARKKNWPTLTTDEDRASVDPERFLRDRFFRQPAQELSAKGEAIILKTNDRIRIHQAAGPLDLFTESTEAPSEANGSVPRIDRWIVVGTSKAAVSDKIREINRPSKQKAFTTPKEPKTTATKSEPKTGKAKSNSSSSAVKTESKIIAPKKESQTFVGFPPKRKSESSPPSGLTTFSGTEGPPRKKQTARKSVISEKFVGPFLSSESPRKSVGSYNWPDDSRGHTLNGSSAASKIVHPVPYDKVKKESADSKSQIHWDVTGKWRIYCQALEEE